MNLEELRSQIEEVDQEMMKLFIKRMNISKQIGLYKKEHHLAIFDAKREEELIEKYVLKLNEPSLSLLYKEFIIEIMKLSKEVQK
ncbi:MAG: chorismate mutase [Acholeplasmataceae bacterium]|jgi:monofunctional chorismate mutase|nr:chorismate mutase [Acholeplasmataceae bacterium]